VTFSKRAPEMMSLAGLPVDATDLAESCHASASPAAIRVMQAVGRMYSDAWCMAVLKNVDSRWNTGSHRFVRKRSEG